MDILIIFIAIHIVAHSFFVIKLAKAICKSDLDRILKYTVIVVILNMAIVILASIFRGIML